MGQELQESIEQPGLCDNAGTLDLGKGRDGHKAAGPALALRYRGKSVLLFRKLRLQACHQSCRSFSHCSSHLIV